jgi:DNA-binding LacI/PurR family transcriptional regulator
MSEPFPELTGDYVGDDDEAGGRLAVRHLLESGRRHIAYLGSHQHSASDNSILKGMRLEAGSAGMCAAGPSVRWNCIDESGTRRAVKSLMELRRPPDAIVAFSDIVALWAMRQIQNSGRNVPEDVALVGYDDTPIAAWAPIPLTSVAQPSEQIGRRAAKLLLDIILKRHYDDSSGPIIFPPTLNVRASTQTTGAKT